MTTVAKASDMRGMVTRSTPKAIDLRPLGQLESGARKIASAIIDYYGTPELDNQRAKVERFEASLALARRKLQGMHTLMEWGEARAAARQYLGVPRSK